MRGSGQIVAGHLRGPDGQRLVAAEFTILSTGGAAYDDPGNLGAKVIDEPPEVTAYASARTEHRLLPLE
ncbi:hypothetical protein ABZS88_24175 [Streptomyces sp. NPDC005480]|uniref:hypothetical protein n=1 Tax=Streptomyces sp. NPDC005480 TaxID=3154880 RepID=UPI00339F6805